MPEYRVKDSQLALVPLLIYNHDLNHAIKYWKKHNFADDMNFLHFNSSIKTLNGLVNLGNKISICLDKC